MAQKAQTKEPKDTKAKDEQPVPTPFAAPPMPMGIGVMRVQKQRYRDWITAGGTPPIYTS